MKTVFNILLNKMTTDFLPKTVDILSTLRPSVHLSTVYVVCVSQWIHSPFEFLFHPTPITYSIFDLDKTYDLQVTYSFYFIIITGLPLVVFVVTCKCEQYWPLNCYPTSDIVTTCDIKCCYWMHCHSHSYKIFHSSEKCYMV